MSSSRLRAPTMTTTRLPARFMPWAMGWSGATPMPPPTQTTVPTRSMWVALPSGPSRCGRSSPARALGQLAGGLAHGLEDQGDGAGRGIGIGDGERDALVVLAQLDDDELAGLALARDQRGLHVDAVHLRRDQAGGEDAGHAGQRASACSTSLMRPRRSTRAERRPSSRRSSWATQS
jgi:hypothetical protein